MGASLERCGRGDTRRSTRARLPLRPDDHLHAQRATAGCGRSTRRRSAGTSPRGRRPSLRLTRRTAARPARPRGPPPRGTARACRTGRGRRRRTAPRRRAASRRGLAGAAIANEHRQIVCVSRRKTFAGDVRKPPRTITKVARTTAPSAHIFGRAFFLLSPLTSRAAVRHAAESSYSGELTHIRARSSSWFVS